jgi:hypothetical protein
VEDRGGAPERPRLAPDLRSADRVDAESADPCVESGATCASADLVERWAVGTYGHDDTPVGGSEDEAAERVLIAAEVVDEHSVVAVAFDRGLQLLRVQSVRLQKRTDRDSDRQVSLNLTPAPQPAHRG